LIAVCGGELVVVAVDVALTGNTCLVEVFAFVLTSAFAGSDCWPELIAAAFVCNDFDTCGPAPV